MMSRRWLGLLLVAMWIGRGGVARAAPVISVTPSSPPAVDFGSRRVKDTAASPTASKIFTIKNVGSGNPNLAVSGITFTNSDYALNPTVTFPITLAPSDSRDITVEFNPSASGTRTATMTVVNNDATKAIDLSGVGTTAIISVPTAIDFGSVIAGTSSLQNVSISNTATMLLGPLTVTSATITTSAFFSFGNTPGCSGGLSCTFSPPYVITASAINVPVICQPPITTTGTANATVTFTSDSDTGGSSSTTLSCTAASPSFEVTPVLAFGDFRFDSTPQLAFYIKDTGQADVTVLSVTFTPDAGTAAGEFAFAIKRSGMTANLPQVLSAGEQLDVNVVAQPNNRIGAVGGKVTVHTNASVGPDQQVTLTGNATAAVIGVPSMVDFDAVDIDGTPPSKMIVLSNTGAAKLDIVSIARIPGGSPAFTTSPLPTSTVTVAPGANFSFTITYAPRATRPLNQPEMLVLDAVLSGVLNTPAHAMITVQGRGIDRVLAVDAVTEFPPTFRNPGSKAPVKAVTVHNDGEATLKITGVMVTEAPMTADNPVWRLVDPSPIDIPGGGSRDMLVRFLPKVIDDPARSQFSPIGKLILINNDNASPMASVSLTGTCIPRDVHFGPEILDVGVAMVDGEAAFPGGAIHANNRDASNSFTIHHISSDDSIFLVPDATGSPLIASGSGRYPVVFQPVTEGSVSVTARIYLDEDPEPHAEITLSGRAVSVSAHGGGCSAGTDGGASGPGGGAIRAAAIAAFLLGRRRRGRRQTQRPRALGLAALVALLVAMVAIARPAVADDVVIGVFDPAPATSGTWFQLETPEVGPAGSYAASAVASYATDLLVFDTFEQGVQVGADHAIRRRATLALGGAYAFLDRFEAGLRLPVYSQRGDDAGDPHVTPPSGTALGDLTLHLKARLLQLDAATLGAIAHVTLPTATAGQFTGVDAPSIRVLGLALWSPTARLSLSASAGGVLRKTSVYRDAASISQGSGLAWGAGASWRLTEELSANAELFGEILGSGRTERAMNTVALAPVEALVGAAYRFDRAWSLGTAFGRGLGNGIGAPEFRGVVTVSYTTASGELAPLRPRVAPAPGLGGDRDGDGIADALDRCPNEPEDKDGFQDDDGCPDLDNDGDGIPDALDRCPDEPEDKNGFEDDDGCPDRGTGIAAPDPKAVIQAAEDTFNRGLELMQKQRYPEACAVFEQSQRLDPQFGTQYQIAGCYLKIGKPATAWNMYRELARTDSNPTRRPKAGKIAALVARRVPRIKLVLRNKVEGLQVVMNGTNASALVGTETPVDLGSYSFVASAPGHREWRKTVEVKDEGKLTTVTIELESGP